MSYSLDQQLANLRKLRGFGSILTAFDRCRQTAPLTLKAELRLTTALTHMTEWRVPSETCGAALFIGFAEEVWTETKMQGRRAQQIQRIVDDFRKLELGSASGLDLNVSSEASSRKQRRLMRQAYLDLPLVLLSIADHAGRVASTNMSQDGEQVWRETEAVFIPVLEMLGLWELRREWVTQVLQQLHQDDYIKFEGNLNKTRAARQDHFNQIDRRLREAVEPRLTFICQQRLTNPAMVWERSQRGEPVEELYTRTTVDVTTRKRSECYRILEAIHAIGMPAPDRFADYISHPQSNGYRALHTTVTSHDQANDTKRWLVEFRIKSEDMVPLNHLGVVEAIYLNPRKYTALNDQLWLGYKKSSPAEIELLKAYDIQQKPEQGNDQIYIFTPRGEVKSLRVGSTAVDFAYRLHSQIGHRSREVKINGQAATHATPLTNGDLVEIITDPFFHGPDPAWLHITRDPFTRSKIKRGLSYFRRKLPPGLQLLNRFFEALAQRDGFVLPPRILERYLAEAASAYQLGTVENLYRDIFPLDGRRPVASPDRLVAQILEAELAHSVLRSNGSLVLESPNRQLAFSDRPKLQFCSACKPVPGNAIALETRSTHAGEKFYILHRLPDQHQNASPTPTFGVAFSCLHNKQDQLDKAVKWGDLSIGKEIWNITVLAPDRYRLLGDAIEIVYGFERLNLIHVDATVDSDGMADLLLTLECPSRSDVERVNSQLVNTIGGRVLPWPDVSLRAGLTHRFRKGNQDNPYATGVAIQDPQLVFGRARELEELRDLLLSRPAKRIISLYGNRRSGKTTFAHYLESALLPYGVVPIFVDLELVSSGIDTPQNFYLLLAECIQAALAKQDLAKLLPIPSNEQFIQYAERAFIRYLREVEKALRPRRLLLMLDEFNILVEKVSDPVIYQGLRGLVTEAELETVVMPIINRRQYQQVATGHPVQYLYAIQGGVIPIKQLDPEAAEKLIREPVIGRLDYDTQVVEQILTRTDRHPYLMNLICYELFRKTQNEGRRRVHLTDLNTAVEKTLFESGRSIFNFLLEHLTSNDIGLITTIAKLQTGPEAWVDLVKVSNRMSHELAIIDRMVDRLCKTGLLKRAETVGSTSHVVITVDYFREWVSRESLLDSD